MMRHEPTPDPLFGTQPDPDPSKQDLRSTTLLLLEANAGLRRVLRLSFEQLGLRVVCAEDRGHADRLLDEENPELLVMDWDFSDGEGDNEQVIERFREREGRAVVVTTIHRPQDGWRRQVRPEAVVYKPFDVRYLCRRVSALIDSGQAA